MRRTMWGFDKECLAMGRFYDYLSHSEKIEPEKVGRVMAWAVKVFDKDQDGEINEAEFLAIMKQTSIY